MEEYRRMRRSLKENRTALEGTSQPFSTEAVAIDVQSAMPSIEAPPAAQPRPVPVQLSAAGASSVYAPSIGPIGSAPLLSAVPSSNQYNNYPNAAPARIQKVRQADVCSACRDEVWSD